LRELNRQIPILAADFQFEVEQLSANIEVLSEQTSELKGDIIGLQEEIKAEALIEKLETEKKKRFEFDLTQLRERAQ
jgi:peptidoglycan hydrolase CwlO-like protein